MQRLVDIIPEVENRIEHLREIVDGFEIGQIFLTALELDVFSELLSPLGAEDLATKLGVHAGLIEKMLDVLVGMNLLIRSEKKYCTDSSVAPFLVQGSPYFARYLTPRGRIRDSIVDLKGVLRAGPPECPEEQVYSFNRDDLDWMARMSLLGRLQGTIKQVISLPEFRQARRLLDLGGGHGLFGVAFAQEKPDLKVVIFDKPDVVKAAQTYIDQYSLTEQVATRSGDYLHDRLGTNYDIIFEACSFGGDIQDFRSFFQKVSAAMNTGGLFIRLTFTLDDNRNGPLLPLLWNFKNHLIGNGRKMAMSNAELSQLLDWAGLKTEKIVDMSTWCMNPLRLIISRKIDSFDQ